MENNYFDMLGQNVPNETQKEEGQDMVNLTVRADAECAVFCDGDFLFTLEAGKLEKTQAPAGQHLLEFKSLEDDNIVVEKEVDFSDVKKNYLVIVREFADMFASKKAKAAEEKAAKEAEEKRKVEDQKAKRKAEEDARRRAEAEAKRKAEEAAKRKVEEEAKRKAEAEAKRKAEEAERKRLEEAKSNRQLEVQKIINELKEVYKIDASWDLADCWGLLDKLEEEERDGIKDPEAQYIYAMCLCAGGNTEYANVWFTKSAEQGYDPAQWHLREWAEGQICEGKDLYNKSQYDSAISCLKKGLEYVNDPEALYTLGRCYYFGNLTKGKQFDLREGAKWVRKAAEKGYSQAQCCLANYYNNGKEGVDKDLTEAAKWYRKAAEQGESQAIEMLASYYRDGKGGVPKNHVEAAKLYRKIARKDITIKWKLQELAKEGIAEAKACFDSKGKLII